MRFQKTGDVFSEKNGGSAGDRECRADCFPDVPGTLQFPPPVNMYV